MNSRIGKTVMAGGRLYLTCEEVITFLLEYLTRELIPAEEVEFERHLSICPSCVAYVKTYKDAVRLGQVAMREAAGEPPPELGAELVHAILGSRS